jgi:hypothetical protein
MNTKTLLAGIAASVFFFFGGWLIYGMLLAETMTANVTVYEGLMKSEADMNWIALIVSNLAIGFLIALICDKTQLQNLDGRSNDRTMGRFSDHALF